VHTEAKQRHQRHGQQRRAGAQRHASTLAVARRGEHEERQHQPRGELHADARRERRGGRARMRARPAGGVLAGAIRGSGAARAGSDARAGGQRERRRHRQQQQRVVVRPALRQRQHHRVQADERRRPRGRVPETAGSAGDQRHRAEAREHGDCLECPKPARQPQRHERVAQQREQRTVRRVQERPADELVHGVGRRFGGEVRVRVKAMQGPQARERQVAEHVLGNQRRSQQQDRVGDHDRHHDRRHPQLARRRQHQQVASAHGQHQRLEPRVREPYAQPAQRTGHPRRPAAGACGNELGRRRGSARAQQRHTHDDAHQPQQPEHAHDAHGPAPVAGVARAYGLLLGDRSGR
jgi:hypothetical protein